MDAVHNRVHNKKRFIALVVCLCLLCSFISCCVDIDHPLFFMGLVSDGRAFHPLLIPLGIIFIVCGSGILVSLVYRFRK